MKNRNIIFSALFLFLGILFFSSCEKEAVGIPKDENTSTVVSRSTVMTEKERIDYRNRYAQVISVAAQDLVVQNWLIEKCKLHQNGQPDILYYSIKDELVTGKGSRDFKSLLIETDISLNLPDKLPVGIVEFYDTYFLQFDQLISLYYFNPEELTGPLTSPLKVFVGKLNCQDFEIGDDMTMFEIGGEYNLTYNADPTFTCFAVKTNERILAFDEDTELVNNTDTSLDDLDKTYIDKDYVTSTDAEIGSMMNIRFVFKKNYDDDVQEYCPGCPVNSGPTTTTTGGPNTRDDCDCTEDYERDCHDGYEAVSRLKYADDYECFPNGSPEFMFIHWYGDKYISDEWDQEDITLWPKWGRYCFPGEHNKWYTESEAGTVLKQVGLRRWELEENGREMFEYWVEDDWFCKVKLTVGLSAKFGGSIASDKPKSEGVSGFAGAGVSFDVKTSLEFQFGDDEIGGKYIDYRDEWCETYPDWGYQYHVGELTFHQLDRGY